MMVIQCSSSRAILLQLFIKYEIFSGLKAHSAHCGDSEKARANSGAVYSRRQRSGPRRWSVHLQDCSGVCCLQQRMSQGRPCSQTYHLSVTDAQLLLLNKLSNCKISFISQIYFSAHQLISVHIAFKTNFFSDQIFLCIVIFLFKLSPLNSPTFLSLNTHVYFTKTKFELE